MIIYLLKMGRYFNIFNMTKKQCIDSYWKSNDWCNCHHVMHQFHWDKTDKIFSQSDYVYNQFCYDENNDIIEETEEEKITGLRKILRRKRKTEEE